MTTTTCSPVSNRRWPEWIGAWPRLKGRQEPEFESKFAGDESQGDRCAQFGFRIGLRCLPWEWLTLRAVLSMQAPDENGDRLFTHRDVAIECTRQQGKTLMVVLLILFHLFVLPSRRIVYTAQRWATASDVFDRVLAVIDRVPSLKRRLAEKPSKAGNRGVIKLKNGARADFGPRSQDFARGFTEVDLVIIDEAYDVDPGQEANLTGSQSAAKNPQTVYISTPPVAAVHPKCQVLAGLHRLGHARSPDLYYALYAAPRTMARAEREAWAMAQPSYGVATNEREIRSKLAKAKTVDQRAIFDADYLGWGDYPPDETEISSPIPEAVWVDMRNPGVELTGPRTIAVHRSRNRHLWSIVAAQFASDGRVHIEVGPARSGRHTEIAEYLITKVADWNPSALVIDRKNSAAVLEPLLIEAGIEPEMMGTPEIAHASGGFLDAALAGKLSHSDQEIFNDAIVSASMRELPGGDFAWAEDDSGVAGPLIGASQAHWALLKFGKTAKRKTVGARSGLTTTTPAARYSTNDYDAMSVAF